jgi:hypothetical protein
MRVNPEQVRKKSEGKYGSYYGKDMLGRTVFMPVTFLYQDTQAQVIGELIRPEQGVYFPYAWVRIRSSKRIVETPLTERRGTIKELINIEDYYISIQGFAMRHDGSFSEEEIEALKTLYETNRPVHLRCIVSDIFLLSTENGGQDKVVITDFDLRDNTRIEHVRGFEI